MGTTFLFHSPLLLNASDTLRSSPDPLMFCNWILHKSQQYIILLLIKKKCSPTYCLCAKTYKKYTVLILICPHSTLVRELKKNGALADLAILFYCLTFLSTSMFFFTRVSAVIICLNILNEQQIASHKLQKKGTNVDLA